MDVNHAIYKNNSIYKLKLMSEQELRSKSVAVYDLAHLTTTDLALDSPIFGSTVSSECAICHNTAWNCPGHFALIEIPFPIPVCICLEDWKKTIPCICPVCSHIPIAEVGQLLQYPQKDRMSRCKKLIDRALKQNKNSTLTCPRCGNKIVPYVIDKSDPIAVVASNKDDTGYAGRINPSIVHNMLQNFTEIEELGFSEEYHPKNFMTNYIPIVTTKLRQKSYKSGDATLTSYYANIIRNIVPAANTVASLIGANTPIIDNTGGKLAEFTKVYNQLWVYYEMMTVPVNATQMTKNLAIMQKNDRKHYDESITLMGRFKGKDKSIFGQGIVYSRANKSVRTVLGGAVDVPFTKICMPDHVSQILAMDYKVYEENIDRVRSLILAMQTNDIAYSETLPKILQIIKTDVAGNQHIIRITKDNAKNVVMKLAPGDKIAMSLTDTDFAYMSRFPIVREESLSAFEVQNGSNSIITIPLPVCKMKMADFDGDEIQAYIGSSHNTDAESLLTASTYTQFLAYKDGNPAIWYAADAPVGIGLIKNAGEIHIHDGTLLVKSQNVIELVESFLPKDLSYCDSKTEIVNGKFKNNKTSMNNQELYKYINTLYGCDVIADLMYNITTLAYDLCKEQGVTLGFEIKLYGDKLMNKQIDNIKDEMYAEMCTIERSNDPHKDSKILSVSNKYKPQILKMILEAGAKSNIEQFGFLSKFKEEYYQSVVQIDHSTVGGTRIQPTLADGTRTSCAGPRYSIDPCDYGYERNSYSSDIRPLSHFYECKEQRLAIYNKGASVRQQGYFAKRAATGNSKVYGDYNGATIDSYRILAPQYGASGLNPRLYVEQPLTDITLSSKEFTAKYKDERLQFLHKCINDIRDKYKRVLLNYTKPDYVNGKFAAGFNYEVFIDTHTESNKSTPQKDIDAFISSLFDEFCTPANKHLVTSNFWQHEYYFRQKLSTCILPKAIMQQLIEIFSWTLLDGGDGVGSKAALACTEPLTQAVLHAIHNAGGKGSGMDVQLIRSAGITRFEELMTKPKKKDTASVMVIKLYDDSKENCEKFVCQNETIVFNDIWSNSEINMSTSIPEVVRKLHPNIDFTGTKVSNYYMTMLINLAVIADYGVSIADIIYILTSRIPIFEFITGYAVNDKSFLMCMFFKQSIGFEKVDELSATLTQNKPFIIHGSCIQNARIVENKSLPGHYIIECNDIVGTDAFNTILHLPEVDPAGCQYNDMRECFPVYGVCETNARHIEELIYAALNLSATTGILQRHYKVIADIIYASGSAIYNDRTDFRRDRYTDTLRYVQFENASNMIRSSIQHGDINPVADPFSSIIFNEDCSIGTGASKISLYQSD